MAGIEYSIGTKFIDKFKTNPVTAKRDYLSLVDDKYGYYSINRLTNRVMQTDLSVDNEALDYLIPDEEVVICKVDEFTRKRKQ